MIKMLLRSIVFLCIMLPFKLRAQQPSDISGLKLWLDAADVTGTGTNPAAGSSITTWSDKSGNNNHGVTASGQNTAQLVANEINGRPVLRFTRISVTKGSAYRVPLDIRATTSPTVTIFTVYKQGAQGGDQGLWGDDNGEWDRFYFSSWPGNASAGANNGGASLGPSNPPAIVTGAGLVNTTRLLTAVYDHGASNGSSIYFNGQVVTNFTDNTHLTNAQTNFYIGFDGDDNCYNGDVAEVIVYNRKLTACEILKVNRYLKDKYGVAVTTVTVTAGGTTALQAGKTVTLTASANGTDGTTTYQWLRNGNPVSGATAVSLTTGTPGNYRVVVNNGCIDTSAVTGVTVNVTGMTAPGNTLAFDGSNDYVNAGAILTASYTKEAWVYVTAAGVDNPILSGNTTGADAHAFGITGTLNKLSAGHNGNWSAVQDNEALSLNRWHHVAVTYDAAGTTMRLYKDGALVSENTNVPAFTGSSTALIGGFNSNGTYKVFGGRIDEVRIYNTALPASAIRSEMYSADAQTTGLVAAYNFDEGTAGANNAGVTILVDRSPNQHYAVLQNFALTGATSNWLESYAMVLPATTAATAITYTDFTANWTASTIGTATGYLLDVATDAAFTSLVPGYNALSVTGLSKQVTGLQPVTTYYYRVRADKTSVTGQGAYSNSSSLTTLTPQVDVTGTALVVCRGNQTGALKAAFDGGSGTTYTIRWYKNDVAFTTNVTSQVTGTVTQSTATALGAGMYKVEVLNPANTVLVTAQYELTDPLALTITPAVTGATCFNKCDASVVLSAAGGVAPYQYTFGTNPPTGGTTYNHLCSGTYPLSVTDNNGCTVPGTAVTIANPAPTNIALYKDTLLCKGSTLTVNVTNALPSTYAWTGDNGFTSTNSIVAITTPGTYKITVTQAGGCTYMDSIKMRLTAQEAIPARMVMAAHAFADETVVAVNLTDQPQTQAWVIPAGAQVISESAEKLVMKFPATGRYETKLGATSYNACVSRDSASILIEPVTAAVSDSRALVVREVMAVPNPTTGQFNLSIKLNQAGKVAVRIYSVTGLLAYSALIPDNGSTSIVHPVNLSGQNKGTYIIVVETANSNEVRKLLLN